MHGPGGKPSGIINGEAAGASMGQANNQYF